MTDRRAIASEALLVLVLLVIGSAVGLFASRHFAGQPRFYQDEFGPAVMIAAGRGFMNPLAPPGSPVADFLALRRSSLSLADAATVNLSPPDTFQHAERYLMLTMGWLWRTTGISWPAVSWIGGALYGLTIAASFLLFRVWLSRALAAAGAAFLLISPLHLAQVPHVRDYSKAPFIVAAIALTAIAALRPLSRRGLLIASAACGAVIGIGLGFRMDPIVMAPMFVSSLLLFRGARPWTALKEKGLAVVVFAAALAVTAGPVLFRLSTRGSNGYHVILLGYADQFDSTLGVSRPAYSWLPFYDDRHVTAMVSDYSGRTTGASAFLSTPEYDAAARSYWLHIVRDFPADIAMRALAAANQVMNFPFDNPALTFLTPPGTHINPLLTALTNQSPHRFRLGLLFEWLSMLNGLGVVLAAVLIGAAGARSVRLALFAVWMIAALAGYSSLQFADRHTFHLQVIAVGAALVTLAVVVNSRRVDRLQMRRAVLTVAAVTATTMAVMATLRAYQTAHVSRLVQSYIALPKNPVEAVVTPTGYGTWRARWDHESAPLWRGRFVPAQYYVVEFDAPEREESAIEVHYRSVAPETDFTRVISMPASSGVGRVFIPAYGQRPEWEFDGLELSPGVKERLRGIYRVSAPPALLLDLRLPGKWQRGPLYQQLHGGANADEPVSVVGTREGDVSKLAWIERLGAAEATPRADAIGTFFTKSARVTAAGIEMNGRAQSQSAYLIAFKGVDVDRSAALVVRGRLDAGAIAIGVLQNARWSAQTIVTDPGDFIAVVDIPGPGRYEPILTSATRRDGDRVRFTLSRFGIVTAQP